MSFFSEERSAELREIFFESAQELLQAMNDAGLELEERPGDPELVRRVRRAVHTLKGDSAACGFRELSELAHELEDILVPGKMGEKASALAEAVLAAADTFHAMIAAYRGSMQPPAGGALREHIHRLLNKEPGAVADPGPARTAEAKFEWTEYERLLISEATRRGERVYHLALELDPENQMPAAAVQLSRKALESAGRILAFRPEEGARFEGLRLIEAALSSAHAPESLANKCTVPGIVQRVVVKEAGANPSPYRDLLDILLESEAAAVSRGAPASESATQEQQAKAKSHSSAAAIAENTLRVDTARIENVMNLVGELIIGKSMLHRTLHEFELRHSKDPLRAKFADALAFQSRILGELQRSVMKMRMVPVDQLFRRFPRIVRDVAKLQNKDIAVEITGQNTDLDKGILDELADPLAHLVRNAAAHGIETPAERTTLGKPARGAIFLGAYHQGNQVVIEVSDDGRGLHREKIVARAIEAGHIAAEEAQGLGDEEVYQLIFKPGLTTADEVTEISGRGVGMDVVKSVMDKLKGAVAIQSQPGKGTRFLLMVPLTLASIQALLFRVCGRLYAVPLTSVHEITRVAESEIHTVEGHEIVRLREQVLSLLRLGQLESVPVTPKPHRKLFVIVMVAGSRRFGLLVDSLMGEEELVMKALQDQMVSSELVSGASILGDGTVVLILNVATLARRVTRAPAVGAIA